MGRALYLVATNTLKKNAQNNAPQDGEMVSQDGEQPTWGAPQHAGIVGCAGRLHVKPHILGILANNASPDL